MRVDCERCRTSAKRLCGGLIKADKEGRFVRCDRLKHEQATEMLDAAHLTALVTEAPLDVDPSDSLLQIEGADVVALLATLAYLVSHHLLEGRQAVLYHCPAWAGRGWEMLQADHTLPSLIAYAFPDLVQAQDEYRDALAQQILGRIIGGQDVAIATLGGWEPRSSGEALLIAELRQRRREDAGAAGRAGEDQRVGTTGGP